MIQKSFLICLEYNVLKWISVSRYWFAYSNFWLIVWIFNATWFAGLKDLHTNKTLYLCNQLGIQEPLLRCYLQSVLENIVLFGLSPEWLCSNSCKWAHDMWLCIAGTSKRNNCSTCWAIVPIIEHFMFCGSLMTVYIVLLAKLVEHFLTN